MTTMFEDVRSAHAIAANAEGIALRALNTAQDGKQEALATTSAVMNAYSEISKELITVRSELITVRDECRKEAGYNRLAFDDLGRTLKAVEQALRVSDPNRINNAMADWMSAEAIQKRNRADQQARLFRLVYPVLVVLFGLLASRITSC